MIFSEYAHLWVGTSGSIAGVRVFVFNLFSLPTVFVVGTLIFLSAFFLFVRLIGFPIKPFHIIWSQSGYKNPPALTSTPTLTCSRQNTRQQAQWEERKMRILEPLNKDYNCCWTAQRYRVIKKLFKEWDKSIKSS